MVVDFHAHYPMHLMDELRLDGVPLTASRRFRVDQLTFLQKLLMKLVNNIFNYPAFFKPAVTIDNLKNGDVMVALSVLYAPFDEMDLSQPYGAQPKSSYFKDLVDQLKRVEMEITNQQPEATIAHNFTDLCKAIQNKKVALIHAVEGGFHLGDTDDEIRRNVQTLAEAGVGYITVAHLFFRQIATNAPAIPFLPDEDYERIFPQDQATGLCDLGRTLIKAMAENGILIDITHMSDKAIDDTFTYLKEQFPDQTIPVVATHSACRFDGLTFEYNINESHIQRVADSGGVVGLIACKHWMSEGRSHPKTFDDTMQLLFDHIDYIFSVTGTYDHIAFGSDLDGFIKPALPGLEIPYGYKELEQRLAMRYTSKIADDICSGNALRILEQAWGKQRTSRQQSSSQRDLA